MHIAARTVPRSLLLTITFALLLLADARSAVTALPTSAPAAQAPSCQNPAPFVTANSDGGLPAATVAALGGLGASIASSAASLPGLSVAVVVDQQIDFAAGFGCADIANSVAATPQTVYRIESVTKVFEATAMMQQRDAPSVPGNAFTLQTTVDTLVPPVYYSLQNSQRYSPTFQELASHTAGLPDDPG